MELPIGVPDVSAEHRATARRSWAQLECVHTLVYFAPAVRAAHTELGLPMPAGGYTATRVLGAGAMTPQMAIAALYGFSPAFVHAGLPAAWEAATPQELHAATMGALDATLAPLVADLGDEVRRAAELAREAAELHPIVGRPLAASRATVPWPDPPHLVLWEAATRIRESRGDGHHALCVAAGLDGCEVHLTVAGDSPQVRRDLQRRRGWADAEWDAAIRSLQDRGLLSDDGTLSAAGEQLRARLEAGTDALAAPPWQALGAEMARQLEDALTPIVAAVIAAGILPDKVTRRVVDRP